MKKDKNHSLALAVFILFCVLCWSASKTMDDNGYVIDKQRIIDALPIKEKNTRDYRW